MNELLVRMNAIASRLMEKSNVMISADDVCQALFMRLNDAHDMEVVLDVWSFGISADEACDQLKDFDFSTFEHAIETEPHIIPAQLLIQQKVRIKAGGLIWYIHRYDADPFPSNPHAHLENQNIKLHLGTGQCFAGRKYISSISRKDLIFIRTEAAKTYKDELPPLEV